MGREDGMLELGIFGFDQNTTVYAV